MLTQKLDELTMFYIRLSVIYKSLKLDISDPPIKFTVKNWYMELNI